MGKLNKLYNIKPMISIFFLLLCIVVRPGIYAKADDADAYERPVYDIGVGDTAYSLQDLLSRYEGNSTTYKRNMLDYQIQALNGTIADENYASIDGQYSGIVREMSILEDTKEQLAAYRTALLEEQEAALTAPENNGIEDDGSEDTASLVNEINSQIAAIDVQLAQYGSSRSSLKNSLSEAGLQEDVNDFYNDYQGMITKEAQNKLKNEFLKRCYSLMLYKEQLDFDQAYQEYLKLVTKADLIKYKFGMINQVTLDRNNANLLKNELAISKNQDTYDAELLTIKNETKVSDNAIIRLNLINSNKYYDLELAIKQYLDNNAGYHELLNYKRSYQNYLGSSGTSYASYQQTILRIDDYQLQIDELEDNIRSFVKNAVQAYDNASQTRKAAEEELRLKIEMYNITKTKLSYKRASEIELQKVLYEKEAAEAAYYQSCYEIAVWQNILDNNIYGVT